jgi:hypothetical protein
MGCVAAPLPGRATNDALEDDEPEGGQLHELDRHLQRIHDAASIGTATCAVLHLQLLFNSCQLPNAL